MRLSTAAWTCPDACRGVKRSRSQTAISQRFGFAKRAGNMPLRMARRIVLSLTAQRRAASMILTYSIEPLACSFLPGHCLDRDTSDWRGYPLVHPLALEPPCGLPDPGSA